MFDLYKLGLKQSILLENGSLSEYTFTNIISSSSILGKFDWAYSFIEDYSHYLPPEIRDRTRTRALGYLSFHRKDFSATIDHLNNFKHDNLTIQLIVKTMLLRSYFEFFLIDPTYYYLFVDFANAFEKLVKRKNLLEKNRKEGCINLSTFLKKIALHIEQKQWDQNLKDSYMSKVKSTDPLIAKNWLIKKIEEM